MMIEIFESEKQLPPELYFVPTPTNGTMSYDLYYQHIRIHHQHVHDLRSFPITNIGNLQATITVDNPDGSKRDTTFEEAILTSVSPGTPDQKLFYSIEPTTASDSEGRYLLVTHKSTLDAAIQYIDNVFQHMTTLAPDNMARIMRSTTPVTRANHVATSNWFQSYTKKLATMIPNAITTSTPPVNAWKRRPPTILDLDTDDFPASPPFLISAPIQLVHTQRCRLFLGVTTLTDISHSNGRMLCNWAITGLHPPRRSVFHYPRQACLSQQVWSTWRKLHRNTYCQTKEQTLDTPLGPWHRGRIQQVWNWVIGPHTTLIYIWKDGHVRIYERKHRNHKQYRHLHPHTHNLFPVGCVPISGDFQAGNFIVNGHAPITHSPSDPPTYPAEI
jgi:hypothetical protein